jgi:hypothetical protein
MKDNEDSEEEGGKEEDKIHKRDKKPTMGTN